MKLFLLFINLLKFTYQIINIPFKRTESNQFKVFFCIGTPKVCDFLYLSFFERNIELYRKFSYFPEDSTSSHYIDTEEDIYEDIAVFADYDAYKPVMNHFQCRIINKQWFYDDTPGVVGLGWKTLDNLNLINELFKVAQNKNVFYFDFSNSNIVIGDYPKYNDNSIHRYCKLIDNNYPSYFGYRCWLDSSLIINPLNGTRVLFQINHELLFSPLHNIINVSISFVRTIYEYHFNDKLRKQCILNDEVEKVYISCRNMPTKNYMDFIKPISFIFGRITYNIKIEELFYEMNNKTEFLIAFDSRYPEWTFGYYYIKDLNIVYDIDNKKVVFIKKSELI